MEADADPSADASAGASSRRHATVDELAEAETIIDARSPSEFAIDHVPGAVNCPVLSDDERRIVGTMYAQVGAFEARRVGGAMVAANLATHLRTVFADRPAHWKPIVYCWRGGLRSGSMVQWLRLVGWDARQLGGGYKRYRRHVLDVIARIAPTLDYRVLCGPTGSAKTRVLHALAAIGEQTLDLEALAAHKGSVLGGLPSVQQPSQKAFETALATALAGFDQERPVWVEAESRKVGRIALPTPLFDRLRTSACIEIDAPPAARLDYLLADYDYLGDDGERLATQLGQLHGLQSNETIARWQAWARERALAPLFRELMRDHYDPHYARSQDGHYARLRDARRVATAALGPDDIAALAARIARDDRDAERRERAIDRVRDGDRPIDASSRSAGASVNDRSGL